MEWSVLVKTLRCKLLLTQAEFAEFIGVSFATVNRWENDGHEPTMKTKRCLMRLFKRYNIQLTEVR